VPVVTAAPDPFWSGFARAPGSAGACARPVEAWLLQRGMRTLFVRVQRSSQSALAIARHSMASTLTAVLYPGLPFIPPRGGGSPDDRGSVGCCPSGSRRRGQAMVVLVRTRFKGPCHSAASKLNRTPPQHGRPSSPVRISVASRSGSKRPRLDRGSRYSAEKVSKAVRAAGPCPNLYRRRCRFRPGRRRRRCDRP